MATLGGCAGGPVRPAPAAAAPPPPDPADLPPPALAPLRYGVEPGVKLSTVERQAMELAAPLLRRRGDPSPAGSAVLTLAARELAALAASGAPAPLAATRVRAALWNAAASDPWPLAYLTSGPPDRVAEALRRVIADRSFASHLGAGAVEREGTTWLVLLATPRRAPLRPFPRAVTVGDSAVLEGELVTGLADPRLFVTSPDGTVRERSISGARRFRAELRFDVRGRWLVEVVGRGLSGPEVVALFAVTAGAELPVNANSHAGLPEPADPAAAEAQVLEAMNATRRRYGLAPLESSPALQALARAHSAEMARRGLLAHILPGSGEIGERLRRARIPFRKALENLAKGPTALEAHDRTEESPGHRDNLLSRGPTLAGVGIARTALPGGGTLVYLTEVFVEPPGPAGPAPGPGQVVDPEAGAWRR